MYSKTGIEREGKKETTTSTASLVHSKLNIYTAHTRAILRERNQGSRPRPYVYNNDIMTFSLPRRDADASGAISRFIIHPRVQRLICCSAARVDFFDLGRVESGSREREETSGNSPAMGDATDGLD